MGAAPGAPGPGSEGTVATGGTSIVGMGLSLSSLLLRPRRARNVVSPPMTANAARPMTSSGGPLARAGAARCGGGAGNAGGGRRKDWGGRVVAGRRRERARRGSDTGAGAVPPAYGDTGYCGGGT